MFLACLPRRALVAGLLVVAGCAGHSDDAEEGNSSPTPEATTRPDGPPPRSFAPPSDTAPPRPAPPSEAELSAARRARHVEAVQSVDALLERNCAACHGKSVPTAPCGLRFDHSDDLEALALIAPLSAEASRVVQVIVDGSMPPAGVQPRPTPSELDELRAFIDDPSFWGRPIRDERNLQAYADAQSNACDAAPPGFDAGVDAGAADAAIPSP